MLTDDEIGKIMRRAFELRIDGSQLRMLLAIANGTNDRGYCVVSNLQFSSWLSSNGKPASTRAISDWIADLKNAKIINVVQNKHQHERRIYIKGCKSANKVWSEDEMSPEQLKFHEAFPDREINCEVPPNVDIDKLIDRIKRSNFLVHAHNMSLRSCCVKYYKQIMAGWRDAEDMPQRSKFSTGRISSVEEMNSLFQKIEDIEI